MTWWAWTLLWVVLVAAALWVLFQIGRSLWGKTVSLLTELGTAADRLGAVAEELETISENPARHDDLAVFADPGRLRQERILAGRRAVRPGRAAKPGRAGKQTRAGSSH